eukprot:TRINITY_DN11163_c0_g1_i3.p1 TRINITY_DN11163_c0_g1~~TRINITY_DN11163_c0_g1_i3.p1  ORF type:complete len:930 (+),score=262.29 TRINITY_DN11163_c0_g1_i3:313-3102(+)
MGSPDPYSAAAVVHRVEQLAAAPSAAIIGECDRWLQRYQRSPAAWKSISELLAAPGGYSREVQIFAAQTLRAKVKLGEAVPQLGEAGAAQLGQQIMSMLSTFSRGPHAVRTQLCLAMADFTAQGPSPGAAVGQVVLHLAAAGAEALGVLIEFVKVVAEEARADEKEETGKDSWVRCGSVVGAAPAPTESALTSDLRQLCPSVLRVLCDALSTGASADSVLAALVPWVKLCTPAALAERYLVPVAVESVCATSDATPWEEAGDCVAEMAAVCTPGDHVSQALLVAVPQMEAAYTQSQNPRHQRAIAFSLSAIARSHAAALAAATSPDALRMVSLLASCAQHPDTECVASLTYPAMHAIAARFGKLPEGQREAARVALEPYAVAFAGGVLKGVQAMASDHDFRRTTLASACRDAVQLGPVSVTHRVIGVLQTAVAAADEAAAEAALWFIQAAPSGLRADPQSARAVLDVRWPVGNDLPESCRASFAAVCGRLSWLFREEAGAALVEPILLYIEAALADRSQGYSPVREAGGSALVDLSFGCPDRLAQPAAMTVLIRSYGTASPLVGAAAGEDASSGTWWQGVVSAIATALSHSDAAHAQNVMAVLSEQIGGRAQDALSRHDLAVLRGELRMASALLEALPRHNGDADANLCGALLRALWQAAEVAIRSSHETAKDGCRFVSAAAKSAPSTLKCALGQVTQAVSEGFASLPDPDHLRAAATLLTAYARHEDCASPLVEFVVAFVQPTLQHVVSVGFDAAADFASELFGLLRATAKSFRRLLIAHPVTPHCVNAAAAALSVDSLRESLHVHRAAINQATAFLEALLTEGEGGEGVAAFLQHTGQHIVAAVVGAVAKRDLSSYEGVSEILRLCAGRAPGHIGAWLEVACGQLPQKSSAAELAKHQFISSLGAAGADHKTWLRTCDYFNRTIEVS